MSKSSREKFKATHPEGKKDVNYVTVHPYCTVCGTCGYVMCCGVDEFLDKHVKGKTDCQYEATVISEIKWFVNKARKDDNITCHYLNDNCVQVYPKKKATKKSSKRS